MANKSLYHRPKVSTLPIADRSSRLKNTYQDIMSRYDWFVEHVLLGPYYLASDGIFYLVSQYLERRELKQNPTQNAAAKLIAEPDKLQDLEMIVITPNK